MEIGKAIKQSKFKNEHTKMLINILYTAGWLDSQHAQRLKPYGISPQQYNILRILRGQYPSPATVNLLIDRMLDKSSNASRIVDKLEQKGLVKRIQCSNDRRAVDVYISDKGLTLLEEMDVVIGEWETSTHRLSESEAATLNELLDKLRS